MGIIAEAFSDARRVLPRNLESWGGGVQRIVQGRPQWQEGNYVQYATEGYSSNALVYACINELASSVSEPHMRALQAEKWVHASDAGSSQSHRLTKLMEQPNPWFSHVEFWTAAVMYRSIWGNAYALKVRTQSGRVIELWLLRPDRVSIVPDARNFIARYEYNIGDSEPIRLPVEDIIHWKTPNPLNDFYGLSPLKGIAKVVDLDNFGFDFVSDYYTHAGVPGGILTTKSKLNDLQKKEIKERFNNEYGNGKWHSLLVLDSAEATFQAMTANLGAQGLVLPELNKILEARITGAFGVPPTLVGTVIGTEASSYGNKKSERESFWNETIKPLYRELEGPLNRALVPEFPGVQRIEFDLSQVGALLPDADALHTRLRADLTAGGISQEEFRKLAGYPENRPAGHTFLIPSNLTQTPSEDVGKMPEPAQPTPNGAAGAGRGV